VGTELKLVDMSPTPRFDLYTTIHKTQRFHLGRLAERIGRADAAPSDVWAPLGSEVRTWLKHLRAHAQHEHDFIHPLFERCGDCATHLDAEHETLERAMADVEQVLDAGHWNELYGRFAALLGTYFVHIAEEEQLQTAVLWPRYSDGELTEVFVRFQRSRSAEDARNDLELMLPALPLGEIARIYAGIRQSASPAAWEASLSFAKRILPPTELQQLESRLSASGAGL
jgi:Hemerythrin HHE cation binding domain